jgi:hypothetical protein
MLDPSGLRIDLLVLFLRDRYGFAGYVKHAEAGAGCSLIDGADVVDHGGYGNGGWRCAQRILRLGAIPCTSGKLAPTFLV